MVRAFTRNNAEVEAEKGGSFKMFDGNIYGEFIDLVSYDHFLKKAIARHYALMIIKLSASPPHPMRSEVRCNS